MKRASEGNYEKAIGIYKRALELQPSFHDARRDLAMVYMELGDVENATNHLIEVLRLDPKDAWSWVVLGNLYIREKADLETGEKFLRKGLEIKPNDAWALNSLAAGFQKKGQTREAIDYFDKAIEGESTVRQSILRESANACGRWSISSCQRYAYAALYRGQDAGRSVATGF